MEHLSADERIHRIAATQHGVVARQQLVDAGVSPGAIRHRLNKGILRSLHRGVYHTGPITGRYQTEMALVLACGPKAVLSDRTAGGVWGVLPTSREVPIEMVVPRSVRGPGSSSAVVLHRRRLEDDEITERYGLPVTTPSRTVVDLAGALGPHDLERALARATRRRVVTLDEVEAMLRRHPHRRGCRALRALLADAAGPSLTRSQAEARMLALLRKYSVPRPRTNAIVRGIEVDFHWPDRGVVVEVDGFAYHSHRGAFENDRDRGLLLAGEGIILVRVTWRQIQNEPESVVGPLLLTLGARSGWSGPASG